MLGQSFFDIPATEGPARIEAALATAEAALGVAITIYDHAGIFLAPDGTPALPPPRRRHQRPFCDAGRDRPAWDQACLTHCSRMVPDHAAQRDHAFVHQCWKGAAEIVVPILHEGSSVGTLFAGTWRSQAAFSGPAAEGLGRRIAALHSALPTWNPATVADLSGPLTLLGAGLVALWLAHLGWADVSADRVTAIRRYLHLHVHDSELCLDHLAQHLGLSPSHTSRLVADHCGAPFQSLVLSTRIRRAQALLRHTRRPVKIIAERVGFQNEYYFNRAFTRLVGVPPGRWRRDQVGQDQG